MSLGKIPDFLLNFSGYKMNGEIHHSYLFKSFRLDVFDRRLFKNGISVSLEPKVFDVLVALVERGGHLVEKDELLQTVWGDSFVEETNVARAIYTLRKTLGESENGNKFIETVPKKGYRFVAEVTIVPAAENLKPKNDNYDSSPLTKELPVAKVSETPGKTELQNPRAKAENALPLIKNAKQKKLIALLAASFLGVFFLFLISSFFFRFGSPQQTAVKTIAVLPVKPINTATRDELYEIGIADSLIHRIGSIKGFVVRPLSAIRKYADVTQNPLAAGREQQVDYVLAANYQISGGKIRVTAQLFNVSSGQIEDTYKFEKKLGDVFEVQDAIAGEVGDKLLALFATTSNSSIQKRGTANEEAYRSYLQGMYLYDKRSPIEAQKAVEILEQALRLDPEYALAWAGKAHAHRTIANFGRSTNIQAEYQNSIEAINKALALEPNLSQAYSALCENKFLTEYDFDGAENACRRAIELDSNSSLAHQIYARFLMGRGRHNEAIEEIKTAIDLEPTSLFNQRLLGNCLLNARRYAEAEAQFKRVVEIEKDFSTTYFWFSQTLALQGKESEAFEWFMKAITHQSPFQKRDEEAIRAFQTAYQASGWQGVMRERAARFEKSNEIFYHGAAYNAQIENKDKAFEYLEKSYQRREWGITLLEVDPRLDSLRGDPRYDDLVRRVNSN